MEGIRLAKNIITDGIACKDRITVFMDSDTDGVCSGAIIYRYLKKFTKNTVNISWIINNGKEHGLKYQDLDKIIETTDILICCDSSSNDFEQHRILSKSGVEVIVLDHHKSEKSKFATVINSQFNGYKNPELSGAGVCWKFVKYLDIVTGQDFAESLVDLACVGIIGDICDVSEESPENRYICLKGFLNLNNPALRVIVGDYPFNGKSVGWSISPLINAAMRSNNNEMAVKLFLSNDFFDCKDIIDKIREIKTEEDLNKNKTIVLCKKQIKETNQEENKVIGVFIDKKEHTGIIASSLSGLYQRPVIVLNDSDEDSTFKGSIRGFGIESFKDLINNTGLVKKCEGHALAAGIEIEKENYDLLMSKLNELLKDVKYETIQDVDILLKPQDITEELILQLRNINLITGKGFPQISIGIEDVQIENLTLMKEKHTKWVWENLEFISWNNPKLHEYITTNGVGKTILDVLGNLQINEFRNKKTKQVIVEDFKNSYEL
jgi:single-stranded-DNA-specific exonuclease